MELARNAHGFLPLEFVARTKAIDLRALTRPTREELLRRDWLLKIAGMETPGKRAEALSRLIAGVMLGRPEFAAAIGVGNRTLAKYLDPNWSGRISLPVLEKILGLPARQTRIAETSSLQQRLDKALLTLLGRKLHKARFTLPRGLKGAVVTKLAGLTEFSERSIYRNVFSPNPPSRAFVEKLEAVAETHGKLKFQA
jgi:hypothetical protein